MRKTIIVLVALAATFAAYWIYILLTGSTPLEPPVSGGGNELRFSAPADKPQQIGSTVIRQAEQSYYVVRDAVTKQVRQVFGFARLANPGSQSVRWQVEKPYLIFYESGVQIRLDADHGLFQIERTAGGVAPKDAQLEGHVTIRLTPQGDSELAETVLSFDDLMFSSERTEFSTDGPVRMSSSQVDLQGRGLVLLFNAEDGQIDYLHILDLHSLRLRNLVKNELIASSQQTEHQDTAPDADKTAGTSSKSSLLYECLIQDQVKIRYGDQWVVAGADNVSIQNIALGRRQRDKNENVSESAAPAEASDADLPAAPSAPAADPPAAVDDDRRDVVVTCRGGILFKLMSSEPSVSAAMAVAMNGAPLRIEQVDALSPDKRQSIVNCGLLHYNMETDVLKLFAQQWSGGVLLGDDSSPGRIQTQGPVVWDRRAHYADIAGPGTVWLDGNAGENGQIAFSGRMEVFFADTPTEKAPLRLTAVNLTGGIDADLRGQTALRTIAQTASLAFGQDNVLTSAKLDGAVQLNTEGGRLQTETATIAFAADEEGRPKPTQFQTDSQATLLAGDASSALPPAQFEAKSIAYDLSSGSGLARGPVKFVFYQPADPDSGLLTDHWPMEITADGDAEFIAGQRQQIETVVFNRNVRGVRTQQFAAFTQEDAFRADRMIIGLGRDAKGQTGVQTITLRDGDVYAESKRTHETLRLAMTRLSCSEIVYDQTAGRLTAIGPGQIELDNSKADTPAADGRTAAVLSGPSFAQLKGFEKIEWTASDRRILADGGKELLELAYIPLIDGKPDRLIRAAAGRVEMALSDDADGRTQLARLEAQDRVFFEEKGKHILEGAALTYDAVANNGWLSIAGSEGRPCMANGARVPYIHYNIVSGDLETRLSTIPGAVPLSR